jgi:WhiB family redox-sensing transcriptional regulator
MNAAAWRAIIGGLDDAWRRRAACRGHPRPDIFTPPAARSDSTLKRSESERLRRIVIAEAKTVCRRCPVRARQLGGSGECLDFAEAAGIKFGIWGGFTPRERGIKREI